MTHDNGGIVFEDVSKFYGDVLGVNRVTLSLPAGVTSLVGPNGSGKTTLMNLLTGLIRPTRGRVSVLGMTPDEPMEFFRAVGYCTQFDSFPRSVTGWQFVYETLLLHGLARGQAERLTGETLERVGMVEASHRQIAGYSKGMRQKIRLAQAIAHHPSVLVLDEPLNGLDPMARAESLALFESLGKQRMYVVISSHILEEVDRISDRVVLMTSGYVVAEGNIHEVREEVRDQPMQILIRCSQPSLLASLFAFYGPLSLILLLAVWAVGLVVGFGFLQYAFGSAVHVFNDSRQSLGLDLYFSGTTFFTLGLGDLQPTGHIARILTVWEAGTGFAFLAITIGYLPTFYSAFSRREQAIALLDARAGSPPSAAELLRRYAENRDLHEIGDLLHEWEHWSAELLESHISFPPLTLFRSQHSNESWLGSLTTILDVCSLLIVGIEGIPTRQAQLTFAMSRHALVDLSQVLFTPPKPFKPDRLPPEKLAELRQLLASVGARIADGTAADHKLAELRHLYEPYINTIAGYLVLPVPGWFPVENAKDNWQTSAWEKTARRIRPTELDMLDEHL